MQTLVVELAINKQQVLRYYSGKAVNVRAVSVDGRTIRFPARFLRPFVQKNGLYGRFRFQIDDHQKLISMERIGAENSR